MLRKNEQFPTSPMNYPSDTCVRTESGYYLIKGGKKYRIVSTRVLDSWSFSRIVKTTDAAVSKYRTAGKLGFRGGSLIHNIADGKIYLVSDNKRRHITSPDVLERLGANGKDVIHVSDTEILLHVEGEPIG